MAQAQLLGGAHGDELAAAGDEVDQRLPLGVGQRTWFGANAGREAGDGLGVEAIGLGQAPRGTGEVAHLAGIDDGNRQLRRTEFSRDAQLQPTGGLEHDETGRGSAQPVAQPGKALGAVVEARGNAVGQPMRIEPRLGDIDADENLTFRDPHDCPSLPVRARQAAQATVRAWT